MDYHILFSLATNLNSLAKNKFTIRKIIRIITATSIDIQISFLKIQNTNSLNCTTHILYGQKLSVSTNF